MCQKGSCAFVVAVLLLTATHCYHVLVNLKSANPCTSQTGGILYFFTEYLYIYVSACLFQEKTYFMHNLSSVYFAKISTYFGRINSASSGGMPYGYNNWPLLFFLDLKTISTNCCIHTVYLLMMGYR
jgi:hypothetical protein